MCFLFFAHRRSQGVQWVHLPSSWRKNLLGRNLQGKFVSACPQSEQESIFRTCRAGEIWRVEVVHLVVLDRVLRETTKKGRQPFSRKKVSAPLKKSWLRLCLCFQFFVDNTSPRHMILSFLLHFSPGHVQLSFRISFSIVLVHVFCRCPLSW